MVQISTNLDERLHSFAPFELSDCFPGVLFPLLPVRRTVLSRESPWPPEPAGHFVSLCGKAVPCRLGVRPPPPNRRGRGGASS